jgi:putative redox protein
MKYKFEKPVHGTIGNEKYKCTIEWRNGVIISDEPVSSGGKDLGPDPHSLFLASIASCILMTIRMYIDRKGWDVSNIAVDANMYEEKKEDHTTYIIDRDIKFLSEIDDNKKTRILAIVEHCPVSKILTGDTKVRTFLFKDGIDEKKINYSNDEITVVWKPELCQHSTRCFTQLPEVFKIGQKKWIDPNGAPAERIIEQVRHCPSGALTILNHD